MFVSVCAHPFWRRYLGACLRIQKFRSRRPGSGKSLQVGPVGRSAGVSAIVVARADQSPASMRLTLYIGGSSIVLRIQRVELLVQPVLSRDPGVDGAANRFDRSSLHDRASNICRSAFSLKPKKRGPFQLVPVMAQATVERLS